MKSASEVKAMIPPQQVEHTMQSRRSALLFLALVLLPLSFAAGMALVSFPLGPLTHHMSTHILLMNLVAPALAVTAYAAFGIEQLSIASRTLFLASIAQIAALWIVHAPPFVAASMNSVSMHLLAQAALLATAIWFWLAILGQEGAARWRAILALLVTGKLFCLLAALLVFAPRALYSTNAAHHAPMMVADPLSDQYLAGLLMLVVCPLTYVLAGVLIAERWLAELRGRDLETASRVLPAQ